jgi:predicted nucleic acid-binding protein
VSEVWDTTTAARLRPHSRVMVYAREQRELADPVAFSAGTFSEIAYGLRKAALAGVTAAGVQLAWLRDQIDTGLIDVLPFDDRAAETAGVLRAEMPTPPSTVRRSRERSKAESRVAWILDIQTAATAFVQGYDLISADAHHLQIAERLAALAPAAPALQVQAPPRFD